MDRGFFTILGAQFLSALADNALFFAALALLKEQHAPEWHLSMLLWCFTVSYVVLAPFAGSFADSMHKGRAMMICNGIKLGGCVLMLAGAPPILAYAMVGFGAAAYSPAKYGIITEYLPHDKLVAANGWLEGATVGAIIFGTLLGGMLASHTVDAWLQGTLIGSHFSVAEFAIAVIVLLYLAAAWLNLYVPQLNVVLKPLSLRPSKLVAEFWHCVKRLWQDPQGQLSLGVTTLFWGAGATMRLVVLNWAVIWLTLTMQQATQLVAIVAVGIAAGAVLAGHYIPLKRAFRVLPAGIAMGVVVISMLFVNQYWLAALLMFIVGVLSGFFVVPLNAMLQHRGHMLMGAGHSIAVQNFNENLGILVMVGLHMLLVKFFSSPVPVDAPEVIHTVFRASGLPPMHAIIIGFGLFVALTMIYIQRRYRRGVAAGIMHD
ncbi:lysophospholipid transporter LplT [Chitinilyticum piscinae]|uniref:Lysophospholipid transporter LplT n=1 Tax=Chitinilyticum piscinae TaxID=2866724 RepID=A0A8J7FL77_9NEIS|nr:lysophospholipid transporter LplT [Chitinilyticum piscinae]MBE9610112.1 lysophospholipid transporter LplT [Chitinilyticum piscinae]